MFFFIWVLCQGVGLSNKSATNFGNIAFFYVKIFLELKVVFKTSNAQVFLENIILRFIKLHYKDG